MGLPYLLDTTNQGIKAGNTPISTDYLALHNGLPENTRWVRIVNSTDQSMTIGIGATAATALEVAIIPSGMDTDIPATQNQKLWVKRSAQAAANSSNGAVTATPVVG